MNRKLCAGRTRRLFSAIAGTVIGVGVMISYFPLFETSPVLLHKASEIRGILQGANRYNRFCVIE